MPEVQTTWDWLVPTTKELLRPDEVATFLGRKETFVYELIDEGKLEAFEPTDREVKRKQITRRSVLLVLTEQATSSPELFYERLLACLSYLDSRQLARLSAEVTRRRAQHPTNKS